MQHEKSGLFYFMSELWVPIVNFESSYEVSSLGRIRSLNRSYINQRGIKCNLKGKYISLSLDTSGYVQVCLCYAGGRICRKVHCLVAEHFMPNPDNKLEVNHKDGNKTNNNKDNLEWSTRSENLLHSYRVLGRKHNGDKTRKAVISTNISTGETLAYQSMKEAAKIIKGSVSDISMCCSGKRNYAYGHTWRYADKL